MLVRHKRNLLVTVVISLVIVLIYAWQPKFLQQISLSGYQFGTGLTSKNQLATQHFVIITIDDQSVNQLGTWPWSRGRIAELLNKLSKAKPNSIILDLPLDRINQRQGLEQLTELEEFVQDKTSGVKRKQSREIKRRLKSVQNELNQDKQLSLAIRQSKNIYLPMRLSGQVKPQSQLDSLPENITISGIKGSVTKAVNVLKAEKARYPAYPFARYASAIGHDNVTISTDTANYRTPLMIEYKKRLYPSLSLIMASNYLSANYKKTVVQNDAIILGKLQIAIDNELSAWPQYYLTEQDKPNFQTIPAYEILNETTDISQVLKDKLLIIGVTAEGHVDYYSTINGVPFSKPEMLANMTAAIINNEIYAQPAWAIKVQWAVLVLFVLIAIVFMPYLPVSISALTTILLVFSAVVSEFYLLLNKQVFVDLLTPALLFLLAYTVLVVYFTIARNRERLHQKLADSNRELASALQSQGQLDQAMDKLRDTRLIDSNVLNVAYNLAKDYESKRQFAKAAETYDFIQSHNKNFRDVNERKQRVEIADDAVVVRTSGSLIVDGLDSNPVLGRYELQKEIGKGAMGVVYQGVDPKINRTVAIKTLSLAESFDSANLQEVLKRFFREAETAGKLNHPHIVTVYDAGQEHDLTYMAMELLEGHDLGFYVDKKKKPKIDWVLDVAWQVADALDYAHAEGIVHRDIKPANIMHMPDSDTVKITDFGIARIVDDSTTKTGTALGTPCYMSPEQISGKKVDGRSDFFSLGVTLYELITGELPFQGDSLPALVFQITNKRQRPITQLRKKLPACVKTLIDKLLQKDPKDRYMDGAALRAAIERCQNR